jgi:hypothetical protein
MKIVNIPFLQSARGKIISIIIASLLAVALFEFAVSEMIIMSSYRDIEKQDMVQSLQQVNLSIQNQGNVMLTKSRDWAYWDDAYNFLKDPVKNVNFVTDQVPTSTLAQLQINVLMYVDAKGQIIFQQVTDLDTGAIIQSSPVPSELTAESMHLLAKPTDGTGQTYQGIVTLKEGPMLVASVPVLGNNMQPPNDGTLIFGRFIDKRFIDAIATTTQLPVSAYASHSAPADVLSAMQNLSQKNNAYVSPLSEQSIAGYSTIYDLSGTPALELRLVLPRDIYENGERTLAFFMIFTVATFILFGILIAILIGKFVIVRLETLTKDVLAIGSRDDETKRIHDPIKDEVGMVANAIDGMLDNLSSARQKEQAARKTTEESSEKLQERIDEIERLNGLMTGRELRMIELKKTIADLQTQLGKNGSAESPHE